MTIDSIKNAMPAHRNPISLGRAAALIISATGLLASFQAVRANEPVSAIACSATPGPQAPRDITAPVPGTNKAPIKNVDAGGEMSLCNIHFHRNAEHRVFSTDTIAVEAANPGFVCRKLGAAAPKAPAHGQAHPAPVGASGGSGHADCDSVAVGDTIEVHWVFTSCNSPDKPTLEKLGNCTQCKDPVLRVHAKVFLVADDKDKDGKDFAEFSEVAGAFKPRALPLEKGSVEYLGSTTGGSYNNAENCSPVTANWIVQRECSPLKLGSLKSWCSKNIYNEKAVHDVRPLVIAPALLSVAKTHN